MKKAFLIIAMLGIFSILVRAQSNTIRGSVLDDNESPIVGASVIVKGSTIGTATDQEGNFSINVPQSSKTLIFSFIGMETKELEARNNMRVILKYQSIGMEEVIVTSYGGSIKKSSLSGAITQVKGEELNNQAVQSFDQSMAGKMAGVQVKQTSGLLADGVSIRIRGTNSISLSSQPLVVIDGVPITETTNLNVFNGGAGTRFNPMATINPNDIESMEVLKDAAASALYGSRAANGVLLITTKRGEEGKVNISYNSYYAYSNAVRLPSLLGGQDFIDINNEKAYNRWGEGAVIASWDAQKSETDWLKESFRTGFANNQSVSISGGTSKINLYGSVDWADQNGTVIGNSMTRKSFRLNMDAQATEWLKVGISTNYSTTENNGVLSDGYLAGVTVSAYNAPPNVPMYNSMGEYNLSNGYLDRGENLYSYNGTTTYLNAFYHPVATIELQRNRNTADRILGNAFIEITPIKNLKITSKYGIDNLNNFEDQYSSPKIGGLGTAYDGLVQDNIAYIKQWNWQNYANYNFKIQEHSIGLMGGIEYQQRTYQDIFAGAGGFAYPDYNNILDGLYTENFSGGTMNSRGNSSFFGRLNYSWKERYIFEGSFRADSYSGFSEDSRTGYFPGVSAAWRITEEDFMENVEFVDELKFRTSIGIVGNSNVSPYASRTLYSGGQYADLNGFSMAQVGNDALQWERVQKSNIGLDGSVLKHRINFSFDYWRSDIEDMILDAPVMGITGIPGSEITTNIGSMRNQGIELQLNTFNYSDRQWTWTSTFNITTVDNEVLKLAGEDILGTTSAIVGEPLGVWRVYRYAGVDPATGRAGYYDKDKRIKYYNPDPAVSNDQKWQYEDGSMASPLGTSDLVVQSGKSGTPKWYGNLDNMVRYKDFDLNIGLQFAGGNYVLNQTDAAMLTTLLNNNISRIKDRWTTPGQVTDIPKLYHGDRTSLPSNSTLFLEKADFLRLRDVTLGYNLDKRLTQKLQIQSARIYIRGSNLALLTGYTGTDPEANSNRNVNRDVGYDNRSVPFSRTYTFGLNVNF